MAAFLLAIIPAFVASLPLFGSRFIPTHDGEYHIIRFWQFYKGLSSGNWFPRWAPDLNNGYGMPLFTFNYPFPNYIGSLFHLLGFSFVDSVKWTLAAGYILAIVLSFVWLKKVFGTKSAVVGTIVGAFVPYWFVDLYVRGSVGEVWALSWVFGSFAAIAYGRGLWLTLTTALLIVSHNILALIFVPILLAYALLYKRQFLIFVLLGVGTASYFWIPALYEQRFITGISPVNIFDHFPAVYQLLIPSWGTGFRGAIGGGNEMSYQIGIIPLIILFYLTSTCWLNKNCVKFSEVIFFLTVSWIAIVLMLPMSSYAWRFLPFSHFIQYPWRLLSIIVVATPVLAASIARKFRFGGVLALLAVLFAFGYTRPVTYEPRSDTEYLSRTAFVRGTSSLGDAFQTKWMKEEGSLSVATPSGTYVAPIAYYPGWRAVVDGKAVSITPSDTGLISLPVTSGSDMRIWLALTWWQNAAAGISVLSLLPGLISFILKK